MRRIVFLVVLTAVLALMAVSPALAQGEIRQLPLEACGMPQLRELALAGGLTLRSFLETVRILTHRVFRTLVG